jgi:SAM-dependent methyltransferase
MKHRLLALCLLALGSTVASTAALVETSSEGQESSTSQRSERVSQQDDLPISPYLPSPMDIVEGMLELARVGEGDIVFDLGCGDGRIVIAAVKDYGARLGVCVEIDSIVLEQARKNARFEEVEDQIVFIEGDLFEVDLTEATVVTVYLLQEVNLALRPKLQRELQPGTRLVSHRFHMGDWEPDDEVRLFGRSIYLWEIGGSRSTREQQGEPFR